MSVFSGGGGAQDVRAKQNSEATFVLVFSWLR